MFLGGYSEGGYATMAAQHELEALYPDEFALTAAAPMAGPYDLSGTMVDAASAPAANPYYFPYILLAYNRLYGFYDDPGDLFTPAYVDIPGYYDGAHASDLINAALPETPIDAISLRVRLQTHLAGSPLHMALAENDAYRWVPRTPTRLYHCVNDDQVPYANSEVAYDWFVAHGAADVSLESLHFGGHVSCAFPALSKMAIWFLSLRQ